MPIEQAVAEKPTIAEESKPDEEALSDVADSDWIIRRPKRAEISAEESLKRMLAFPERKERFIASVRKGKS